MLFNILFSKSFNNISLIQSQDIILNSGSYEVNKTKIKITTLKGKYYFLKDNNINPYINGGLGYYKLYKTDDYNSYLIGGFGLRYIYNKDLNIKFGYNATVLQQTNKNKTLNSYYSSIYYKKRLKQFNPYIEVTLKYNKIRNSQIKGFDTNLELGLYTHKILSILNYPIYAKVYGGVSNFDTTLSKLFNENRVYTIGGATYWHIGKALHYKILKDLNLNLNFQKSIGIKSLKGSKVGIGVNFLKF